jgi:hypothetical protein
MYNFTLKIVIDIYYLEILNAVKIWINMYLNVAKWMT